MNAVISDFVVLGGSFASQFVDYFEPVTLLIMFASVMVGIIFGILPGLSATVGIALFTGVTYGLSIVHAFSVLFGVYVGAIYGGSISAILVNIPGTGSAAATCLDGYPLGQKGEVVNANLLARSASVVGSLFGMVVFLFFTPIMIRLALKFTSPEFFWLAIFGILICGSISSSDLKIKGWIGGFMGIIAAMVGLEDLQGWERLTFGINQLMTGIPIVPMTIAFFGIPQIVKSMRSENGREVRVGKDRKTVRVLPMIKKHFFKILRWGLIGVGVGAIPGVGENIGAWIAYDDAKRTVKNPNRPFGEGAYEGVMAPETANNGAIGGAVIPLLSLGIPGSPPTAMLLGALMLHGIRPGPMLQVEHPGLVALVAVIMTFATIFLFVNGMLLTKMFAVILTVSPKILMPIIGVLCVLGVYSYNNNAFHLILVFVFGILGYLMNKMDYAPAPIVLGLILGGLADSYFRRALFIRHGSLIHLINRPISFLLFAICVATVLNQFGFFSSIKQRFKSSEKDSG